MHAPNVPDPKDIVNQQQDERAERALARIILPASCTMIGVCATLIGLVKIVETRTGPGHVGQYTSLVLLLFLVSGGASYLAMRHPGRKRLSAWCEFIADACFLAGLFFVALLGVFFAYEII